MIRDFQNMFRPGPVRSWISQILSVLQKTETENFFDAIFRKIGIPRHNGFLCWKKLCKNDNLYMTISNYVTVYVTNSIFHKFISIRPIWYGPVYNMGHIICALYYSLVPYITAKLYLNILVYWEKSYFNLILPTW